MLEEDVRELADAAGSIWVFTGSLFLDDEGSIVEPKNFIGANRVAVPTHFYKTVLAAQPSVMLFAFVMPNTDQQLEGAPGDYMVTVDLVESLSGLDFFSALPDSLEEVLEAEVAEEWPVPEGTNR